MGFVEIANVRKVFGSKGKEVVALDEASLSFNEGEFVALLGPSGCGKTTLLTIVAGLASKTSGSVKVGGREVDGPYPDYGFVFQQPSLMPWRSVLQNVLFPMEILGRNDAQAKARAEQLLQITGLHAFANSRPHELSGGMQQRVSLCRALIHKPKLLLMDEPFGALDEFTRLDMNDLLLKIKAETSASVLFVTHSISEAIYLSDKVVVFTRRPARVSAEFQINIPGPRNQASRFTPEFIEAERRASEVLGLLTASSSEH
ncbi:MULTISPECIES: ABC transporter ATP-binding protein [unclassified Beijerinckia]|uniref:ABC transporter ATP-binding protein n=1 Tax=unclassified Beijerinckia TaxID=2638183 RepID=UPI0008988524|nr:MULTISPECIES: ABC transporter ATP-binding protein [unclassified Beijerinckia]MDH7799518.1 NitT/TauT family transport system ATP-binding protein [Beijerinckia sp. GAS462]SEB45750.1 NitT/TauT family transport system ATP-binding protein [Beijerinckia sp. 28-YEA-48]